MVWSLALLSGTLNEDISGIVLDSSGKPAVGAEVGVTFLLSDQEPQTQIGYGDPPIKTDASGSFSIAKSAVYTGQIVARAKGMAGTSLITPGSPITVKLKPLRNLQIVVSDRDKVGGSAPAFSFFSSGKTLGYGNGAWGTTNWRVPSQTRTLNLAQARIESASISLKFPKTTVIARGASWAKAIGKPAPKMKFTDSLPKTDLASLKGKWIVLDFWATWCQPCLEQMPKWFDLMDNPKVKNKLEVLAFHSPDGASYDQISPALNQIIRDSWQGRKPNLTFTFDRTGETHKAWGISAYPTTLLIDPAGRLVGETTPEDTLKRVLSR